jgi:hypothetical protein
MAENVLDGPRPRGLIFRALSIERPDFAKDDGDALILFRPDQYETWRSNRLPGDFLASIDRVRGAAIQAR